MAIRSRVATRWNRARIALLAIPLAIAMRTAHAGPPSLSPMANVEPFVSEHASAGLMPGSWPLVDRVTKRAIAFLLVALSGAIVLFTLRSRRGATSPQTNDVNALPAIGADAAAPELISNQQLLAMTVALPVSEFAVAAPATVSTSLHDAPPATKAVRVPSAATFLFGDLSDLADAHSHPYAEALPSEAVNLDFDTAASAEVNQTVVAEVPLHLLARSVSETGDLVNLERVDPIELEYFRAIYDEYVDMRTRCGEDTKSLSFERFVDEVTRSRELLMNKHSCRAIRFAVYENRGRAALRATPTN